MNQPVSGTTFHIQRPDMLCRPLQTYLTHKLGQEVQIVTATRFPRGSSRETWFVEFRTGNEIPKKITLRTDFPSGSVQTTSLQQEYYVYERLGHTAVPVAKALWWEDDPDWATRPFYARMHVEGSWQIPHYFDPDPKYDALRIETSRELLRNLSLVHQVDWHRLGMNVRLKVPASVQDAALTTIETIESQLSGFQGEPIPLFVEACAWMKARAPVAACLSLCKGTNGLGEEVFRDGKIVAMSDWEEACIGDPAFDIAHVQDLIPELKRGQQTLWGLEQALDYYNEISPYPIAAASVEYYRLVKALRVVLYSHKSAMATHHSAGANIRQAWAGTEVLHYGKTLLAQAMGLGPPVSAAKFTELNESVEMGA